MTWDGKAPFHGISVCNESVKLQTKNANQGMDDITLGPTSSAKTPEVDVNRMEVDTADGNPKCLQVKQPSMAINGHQHNLHMFEASNI